MNYASLNIFIIDELKSAEELWDNPLPYASNLSNNTLNPTRSLDSFKEAFSTLY
jgi:hypothetical protein